MKPKNNYAQDIENLIIPLIKNSPLGVDTARPLTVISSYWHLDMQPNEDLEKELNTALQSVIEKYKKRGKIREEPLCVDASKYVWVK